MLRSALVPPAYKSDVLAGRTLLPSSGTDLALPSLPHPDAATWPVAERGTGRPATPPVTSTAQVFKRQEELNGQQHKIAAWK